MLYKCKRFTCDTTNLHEDGVPVLLNPEYYGSFVKGTQVGFINNGEFFLDTNGIQIFITKETLDSLTEFLDEVFIDLGWFAFS